MLHVSDFAKDPMWLNYVQYKIYTLCLNGCQLKILLKVFKSAQLTSLFLVHSLDNPKEFLLSKEVSWANFNAHKRIFNWQLFMHRVYGSTSLSLSGKNDVSTSGFFPGFFFFSGTKKSEIRGQTRKKYDWIHN